MITSFSLTKTDAMLWRRHRRAIMSYAVRWLREEIRRNDVRRGVTRTYNRHEGGFIIVTARITGAEYDALHFLAGMQRVSVSSLVSRFIHLWLSGVQTMEPEANFVTNYELNVCIWNANACVCTESLLFYEKVPPDKTLEPPVLRLG